MKNGKGGIRVTVAVLAGCLAISVGFNVWHLANESLNVHQASSYSNQLQSCQSQLQSARNQVSSLQSQLSSYQSQISSLQSELSECEDCGNLQQMSVEANHKIVYQGHGSKSEVVQFTADYPGYVYVSGESTTSNGYIMVTSSFRYTYGLDDAYPYNDAEYLFGTSNILIIPILPGTIRVYFGNHNLIDDAEVEITVYYFY